VIADVLFCLSRFTATGRPVDEAQPGLPASAKKSKNGLIHLILSAIPLISNDGFYVRCHYATFQKDFKPVSFGFTIAERNQKRRQVLLAKEMDNKKIISFIFEERNVQFVLHLSTWINKKSFPNYATFEFNEV